MLQLASVVQIATQELFIAFLCLNTCDGIGCFNQETVTPTSRIKFKVAGTGFQHFPALILLLINDNTRYQLMQQ